VEDGPCGIWPLDPACLCPDWPDDPAAWTERHHQAAKLATDILWRLTAGRFGLCEEKLRPCRIGCTPDGYGSGYLWNGGGTWPGSWVLAPYIDDRGRWFNIGCGCGTECSCAPLCVIELPGPVHGVLEVRIDGQVVPSHGPGGYVLDRRAGKARLVRRGDACWPTCQDMTRPDSQPGTFSVTYLRGKPVPAGGVRAVSVLACELLKQCSGSQGCRLPIGVKQVQREGVTYEILPPGDWLATFKDHMPEVYQWLILVNPHGLKQPTGVFSLDLQPQSPFAERRGPDWGVR